MIIDRGRVYYWYDSTGNLLQTIAAGGAYEMDVKRVSEVTLILSKFEYSYDYSDHDYSDPDAEDPDAEDSDAEDSGSYLRIVEEESDTGWFKIDSSGRDPSNSSADKFLAYIKDSYLHVIKLGTSTSTTASNSNSTNSGSTTPEPIPDVGSFSGWAYFSSYPWVYNYDNKAWYYMQSTKDGLFAYNYNVSGNGWLKVGGVN